jgi:hypothetical protein
MPVSASTADNLHFLSRVTTPWMSRFRLAIDIEAYTEIITRRSKLIPVRCSLEIRTWVIDGNSLPGGKPSQRKKACMNKLYSIGKMLYNPNRDAPYCGVDKKQK